MGYSVIIICIFSVLHLTSFKGVTIQEVHKGTENALNVKCIPKNEAKSCTYFQFQVGPL